MKLFAELISQLDLTTKTNKRVELMKCYFDQAPDDDKLWTIALFSHRRPKRIVNSTLMRQWAAEEAGIPLWLFEDSYHIVGDLAETISLMVDQRGNKSLSLSAWIHRLESIRDLEENEKRSAITEAWRHLNDAERFVFNKIITGGFRIGVSQKLMLRALSQSTGIDEQVVAHRIMGQWSPHDVSFEQLILEGDSTFDLVRPYPFFLAYPLEEESQLNPAGHWYAEYKWDGIRSQTIKRADKVSIWSRGEELITERFPELAEMAALLPAGTVIDAEILTWSDGSPDDFQSLQKRLGRKQVSKKLMETNPVILMAYDLLEWQGEDWRQKPQSERKQQLEHLVKAMDHPLLQLSEVFVRESIEALHQLKDSARDKGAEGLMLKRKDAIYEVGRKRGSWYKWKVDPYTIDAVLTYGMRGHGRRANLFTDYTFGLWDNGQLTTVAKAYSGLTDEEFRKVDAFIKRNTLERFGPVRQVKPELVFELAFENVAHSSRHKSGVAVRFPRIVRWRHDKKPEDANTLADLKGLVKV